MSDDFDPIVILDDPEFQALFGAEFPNPGYWRKFYANLAAFILCKARVTGIQQPKYGSHAVQAALLASYAEQIRELKAMVENYKCAEENEKPQQTRARRLFGGSGRLGSPYLAVALDELENLRNLHEADNAAYKALNEKHHFSKIAVSDLRNELDRQKVHISNLTQERDNLRDRT